MRWSIRIQIQDMLNNIQYIVYEDSCANQEFNSPVHFPMSFIVLWFVYVQDAQNMKK